MSDHKNIWDEQLRQALEGLEGDVNMSAWDAIEGSLDRSDRRKRFFFYFTVAALLVLVGGLSWHFGFNNDKSNENGIVKEQVEPSSTPNAQDVDQQETQTDQEAKDASQSKDIIESGVTAGNADLFPELNEPQTKPDLAPDSKGIAGSTKNKASSKSEGDRTNKTPKTNKVDSEKDDTKGKQDIADSGEKKGDGQGNEKTIDPPKPDTKVNTDTSQKGLIPDNIPAVVMDTNAKQPKLDGPITKIPAPIPSKSYAQGWEIGVSVNSGVVKRLLNANPAEDYKLNPRYLGLQDSSMQSSRGYVVQVNGLYYLKHNFFVSTGISFTQKQENVDYNFTIKNGIFLNRDKREMQLFPLDPIDYVDVKYNNINTYHFAEIPVRIGKIVNLSDRWELRAEAGVNYMLMLGAKGNSIDETYLSLSDLSKQELLKKHVLGAGLKGGIYFTPNMNWRFGVEPGFESSLFSMYKKESAVKLNSSNTGLYFTANYLLRKK